MPSIPFSIRTKLFLLLLALCVPSGIAIGLLGLHGVTSMGERLTEQTYELLTDYDRAFLREKITDVSTMGRQQLQLAEQALYRQAAAVEAALARAEPDETTLYLAEDFDHERLVTERLERYRQYADGPDFVPISRRYPAFLLADETDHDDPEIRRDMLRLAELTPFYRQLYETPALASLWHYTSLEGGIHNVYPGHGLYPAEYDPQQRSWYTLALDADTPVVTESIVDASTAEIILTLSLPVRYPDGRTAGVTALDIPLADLFQLRGAESQHWLAAARLLVLVPETDQRFRIAASYFHEDTARQWDQSPEFDYLHDPDGQLYREIADLSPGRVTLLQPENGDERDLLGVTPLLAGSSYLALQLPPERLTTLADTTGGLISETHATIFRYIALVGILIVLIAMLLSSISSRRVTRPLQRIAATAHDIADGRLDSRVPETGRDEIGRLTRAINHMAEHLESLRKAQDRALLQMVNTLVRALQKKSPYTAAHSGRVANHSVRLGQRIGLPHTTLQLLRRGAMIHDLGKIGVPDAILNKPAPLEEWEAAVMSQHPDFAVKITRPLSSFREVAEIACYHHERWDGTGYPEGLKGEEIPLLARIVSLADAWDAMTGDRVYRKGIPVEQALEILEAEKDGGQWDPHLVREFIAMIREENTPQVA